MTYPALSFTNPVSSQDGTACLVSAKANDLALRDAVLMGAMDGFVFSASGGTAAQPAIWYFKNGAVWLRATITWGAGTGTNGNPTQIVWDLSINTGSDYTTAPGGAIDTQTFTWDSSGNLTATTGAAGTGSWMLGLLGKVKVLTAAYDAHVASTSAHGIGTMAAQAASAVAITGGSVSCTYEREATASLGTSITATTAINWAAGGYFTATITGAGGTFTHSNLPSGVVGYVTLLLTNPGIASSPLTGVKWTGGSVPSFTASGKDLVTLVCADGSTVYGSFLKDVR